VTQLTYTLHASAISASVPMTCLQWHARWLLVRATDVIHTLSAITSIHVLNHFPQFRLLVLFLSLMIMFTQIPLPKSPSCVSTCWVSVRTMYSHFLFVQEKLHQIVVEEVQRSRYIPYCTVHAQHKSLVVTLAIDLMFTHVQGELYLPSD
jgi:hypothetical protein